MTNAVFDPVADTRRRLGISALEAQGLFWLTSIVFFVILLANQTHIETDDAVKLAPQLELLVRLGGTALGGLIGIYGFFFVGRVQKAIFSFPGAWVLGIAVCYFLATAVSAHKSVAIPHLVTFTCIFMFTPTAFAVLGTRRFFEIALLSFVVTMFASWFLYFFLPQYGMKLEAIDAMGGNMQRMSGTSHPNTVAGIAGFALLITCYMMFKQRMSWKLAVPLILFSIATMLMTDTRVAPAAAILSLLFVYRGIWFRRDVFPIALALVAFGLICAVWLFSDSHGLSGTAAESLTRSGNVEELTSFTGRNEIWSFVVKKIGQSPVVGYGPGVAKIILGEKDMLLHPHNVVLAAALTGGVICGFFAVMMFAQQLWISYRGVFTLAALITFYIFLNSLTETFIFSYVPGSSTMLWLAALYWPDLDDGSF